MASETTVVSNNNKKRKATSKRSWVWDYYTVQSTENSLNKCLCSVCPTVITVNSSSTTELIRHLNKEHKITKEDDKDLVSQNKNLDEDEDSDDNDDDCNDDESLSSGKRLKLDSQIVKTFVRQNIPFRVIKSDDFKKLVSMLNKRYKTPSRNLLSTALIPKMVIF